jgi:uncharacterized OB-fold protein
MAGEYNKPLPAPTFDSKPYWEYCKQHELRFQKCSQCGKYRNPATILCADCHSMEYTWEKVSGKGKVYSFIVYQRVYHPGFAQDVPYNVSLIELEEGIRMLSNVTDIANDKIEIGMPVSVYFQDIDEEFALPKFRPA